MRNWRRKAGGGGATARLHFPQVQAEWPTRERWGTGRGKRGGRGRGHARRHWRGHLRSVSQHQGGGHAGKEGGALRGGPGRGRLVSESGQATTYRDCRCDAEGSIVKEHLDSATSDEHKLGQRSSGIGEATRSSQARHCGCTRKPPNPTRIFWWSRPAMAPTTPRAANRANALLRPARRPRRLSCDTLEQKKLFRAYTKHVKTAEQPRGRYTHTTFVASRQHCMASMYSFRAWCSRWDERSVVRA